MPHLKPNNVNVHRAAANIIVSKSRAARGSVCNVLLSRVFYQTVCAFLRIVRPQLPQWQPIVTFPLGRIFILLALFPLVSPCGLKNKCWRENPTARKPISVPRTVASPSIMSALQSGHFIRASVGFESQKRQRSIKVFVGEAMTFEEKRRECSIFFERDNGRDNPSRSK